MDNNLRNLIAQQTHDLVWGWPYQNIQLGLDHVTSCLLPGDQPVLLWAWEYIELFSWQFDFASESCQKGANVKPIPTLNLLLSTLNFSNCSICWSFFLLFWPALVTFDCRIGSGALILFNKCLVLEVQVMANFAKIYLWMLSFLGVGSVISSIAGCLQVCFIFSVVGIRGSCRNPPWRKNHWGRY